MMHLVSRKKYIGKCAPTLNLNFLCNHFLWTTYEKNMYQSKTILSLLFTSSVRASISMDTWPISAPIEADCSWGNSLSITRAGLVAECSVEEYLTTASRAIWLNFDDFLIGWVCPVIFACLDLGQFLTDEAAHWTYIPAESIFFEIHSTGGLIGWKLTEIEAAQRWGEKCGK